MKFVKNHWYDIALAVSVLVLILLNVFFLQNWIDADMAAEMVFSKLLSDEGHFIASPNWFYSTEFRVLYSQLIMVLLFKFITNWALIRIIMNMVFYVLMLLSYFFMMKPLSLKRKTVVISAIILCLPFSETVMIHVFMGNTYMSHIIICFVMMGLFLRLAYEENNNKIKRIISLILFVLLSLICGLSGVRYFLAIIVPLIIASFIMIIKGDAFRLLRFSPSKDTFNTTIVSKETKAFLFSLISLASGFAGYVINALYISKIYRFQTYEGTNFILVYDGVLMERIQRAIGSFLMLFGYISDKSVLSVRGIITLISFVIPICLFFVSIKGGNRENKIGNFMKVFFFTTFIVNTFAFIFTTSTLVARYYITVMIFTLPLLSLYLESKELYFDKVILLIILFSCLTIASIKEIGSMAIQDKNKERREVAEYLLEEGYKFGYATYWNAGIMTELTNGSLEVCGIYKTDMSLFKWSAPSKYYEENYYSGQVFLILSDDEISNEAAKNVINAGELIYDKEGYKVYLYESAEQVVNNLND